MTDTENTTIKLMLDVTPESLPGLTIGFEAGDLTSMIVSATGFDDPNDLADFLQLIAEDLRTDPESDSRLAAVEHAADFGFGTETIMIAAPEMAEATAALDALQAAQESGHPTAHEVVPDGGVPEGE